MKDADAREAKGLVPRNTNSPIQYTTLAISIPRITDALTPLWERITIAKNPMNMVTTVSTIAAYPSSPMLDFARLGVNAPKKSLMT